MDIEFVAHSLLTLRENASEILDQCSKEQAITIPEGFSNNILWNAGHLLVTQQLLTYGLSGLNIPSPSEFIDRYRKGSTPNNETSDEDFVYIKNYLVSMTQFVIDDYKAGLFKNFKPYQTSFGVNLETIEQAIQFNLVHESAHLGFMKALIKLV